MPSQIYWDEQRGQFIEKLPAGEAQLSNEEAHKRLKAEGISLDAIETLPATNFLTDRVKGLAPGETSVPSLAPTALGPARPIARAAPPVLDRTPTGGLVPGELAAPTLSPVAFGPDAARPAPSWGAVPLGPAAPKPAPPSSMDRLLGAQSASADNRMWANLARAGSNAASAIATGMDPRTYRTVQLAPTDDAFFNQLAQTADAPLEAYGQQAAEAARLKKETAAAAQNDPASPQSKAVQQYIEKTFPGLYSPEELAQIPASQAELALDPAKLKAELKAKTDLQASQNAAAMERQTADDAADMERQRLQSRTQLEAARIAHGGAGGAGGGKLLPAQQAGDIGGIDAAVGMLDSLMQTRKDKTGWASGVMQYIPGTDAAQYSDAHRTAAQTIGLILESGKLTKDDLETYKQLLPTAGDGDARAQAKADNIKHLLELKRAGQLEAFKMAGYSVGTLALERLNKMAPAGPGVEGRAAERKTVGEKTYEKRGAVWFEL